MHSITKKRSSHVEHQRRRAAYEYEYEGEGEGGHESSTKNSHDGRCKAITILVLANFGRSIPFSPIRAHLRSSVVKKTNTNPPSLTSVSFVFSVVPYKTTTPPNPCLSVFICGLKTSMPDRSGRISDLRPAAVDSLICPATHAVALRLCEFVAPCDLGLASEAVTGRRVATERQECELALDHKNANLAC